MSSIKVCSVSVCIGLFLWGNAQAELYMPLACLLLLQFTEMAYA